jgi:NAD(P)H-hydrate epimerase
LRDAAGLRVLTPHAGELARLLGEDVARLEADRFGAARRAAEVTGAVVVFKGPHTVVAHPNGTLRFLQGAEPLLATAGSGDVLAGLTAALCVDALDRDALFEAACAAVWAHLGAARLWREASRREGRAPDRGLVASDVANLLPQALASL